MSKSAIYLVAAALGTLILFLGYQIYQQQVALKQIYPNTPPVANQQAQTSTTSAPLDAKNQAIEEENLVKAAPAKDASLAERTAYAKKLEQFAQNATTIEITNCRPSPFIARVEENSAPYIRNNDDVEHTLFLGPTELKVPAKGVISVKIGKIEQYTNFSCMDGFQGLWIP